MENRQDDKEWVDAQGVKTRLQQYREREREIDNQIERLERLEAKLYGVGSPQLTDMPKASSPAGDKTVALIAQKEELDGLIRELVKEQTRERGWIEDILTGLTRSDEKAVIRVRYIDGEKWTEVSDLLFGSADDYEDKRDSYLRRTTKLHGQALMNMAREIARRA